MNSNVDSTPIVSSMAAPSSANPKPMIEGLTQNLEIDLDALGSANLQAPIRGANLKAGDLVFSNWRGLDSEGQAFDIVADAKIVTDPATFFLEINNATVKAARGGYAFLSYQVGAVTAEESLRQFCYVGLRAPNRLPVVQVMQSHALELVYADLQQHANVVTAAYQAIQEGDQAELTVRRFRSAGTELSKLTIALASGQKFEGQPLEWHIPKSQLNAVGVGGHLLISYTITLKGGTVLDESRIQKITMRDAIDTPSQLPAPRVDNAGSDEIDPGNYVNGLPVVIDGYPHRAVGDHLMLAWVMASGETHVQVARLDESSVAAQQFVLHIEHERLLTSLGAVQVFYQYGREGRSLTSKVLDLTVTRPRATPLMPTIRNASVGGEDNEYDIDAFVIRRSGADVIIPDEADLRDNEYLEVHWQGERNAGCVVVRVPSTEGPRVFNVPASFIAANMGTAPSKRFPVFYRIVDKNTDLYWESKPVKLLVKPLEQFRYPTIDCPEAAGTGELWVKRGEGATLELNPWPFVAADQLLSIHFSGTLNDGKDTTVAVTIRDRVPVTAAEVGAGVRDVLSPALLSQLKEHTQFRVWASVSFDNVHWWGFPTQTNTIKFEKESAAFFKMATSDSC